MDDWRSPRAKLKRLVKRPVYSAASRAGVLKKETELELQTVQREAACFFGHRPGSGPTMRLNEERRLEFVAPRPSTEVVEDLLYSENGMAWVGNALIAKYSVQPIRVSDVVRFPRPSTATFIPECAVLQSDFVYSYGDWVHCYLGTILTAGDLGVPVLIPRRLADKAYVRRDLENAGISFLVTEGWSRISKAIVLRKRYPFMYWTTKEVEAFQRAFPPPAGRPKRGSMLYLGRFQLQSELWDRVFPSQETAEFVERLGGKVVKQELLTTSTSGQYAPYADTVIGDHGSGMVNIMFWRPKTVIELVVGRSWVNNTLFIAKAMHIENFAVIEVDGLSGEEIGSSILRCLEYFSKRA
jgi:hypothetical protein